MMLSLLALACGPKLIPITVGDATIKVEVADSVEERAKGLMGRKSMPANQGMLFVYEENAPRTFWMHDTHIPLSIAFADQTGKVVKMADMTPLTSAKTQSLYPATYALEVNQGWFETNGVEVGDFLVIDPSFTTSAVMSPL